jgi:hypothetical protein
MGVVRLWRPGGGRLPRVGDARLPILGHARLPILGHARLPILGHARLPILGAASVAVIVLVGALDSGASEPVKQRRAAAGQPASTEAPTAWAGSVPASPAQLGLELQSLLGQHVVLAADMMRGRLRDDPDLAQAANGALGENTTDLGALVAAAFGATSPPCSITLAGWRRATRRLSRPPCSRPPRLGRCSSRPGDCAPSWAGCSASTSC